MRRAGTLTRRFRCATEAFGNRLSSIPHTDISGPVGRAPYSRKAMVDESTRGGVVKLRRTRKDMPAPPFTGSCPVRLHTGDGAFVGRCYYPTYGGRCPTHGNVAQWLGPDADLMDADDRKIDRLEES